MPKKFPPEFKRDAVTLARRGDLNVAEVAVDLDRRVDQPALDAPGGRRGVLGAADVRPSVQRPGLLQVAGEPITPPRVG